MKDNVRMLSWDWLSDTGQSIKYNTINICWGSFSHKIITKTNFTERYMIRETSSISQEFVFCRQAKEGSNLIYKRVGRQKNWFGSLLARVLALLLTQVSLTSCILSPLTVDWAESSDLPNQFTHIHTTHTQTM